MGGSRYLPGCPAGGRRSISLTCTPARPASSRTACGAASPTARARSRRSRRTADSWPFNRRRAIWWRRKTSTCCGTCSSSNARRARWHASAAIPKGYGWNRAAGRQSTQPDRSSPSRLVIRPTRRTSGMTSIFTWRRLVPVFSPQRRGDAKKRYRLFFIPSTNSLNCTRSGLFAIANSRCSTASADRDGTSASSTPRFTRASTLSG